MDEPLAALLLPGALEGFGLEAHARALLSIPRVIALEPSRFRAPGFMRDATAARQARRLKLPGTPRMVVLYHPAQYPLARGLCSRYESAELWYIAPAADTIGRDGGTETAELRSFDGLARARAARTLDVIDQSVDDQSLRTRLRELDVINPRPFVPGARVDRR